MFRMRANRAYLRKSWNLQPLSRHRNKLLIAANSKIGAKFIRAPGKWTRFGEISESQHLRRIGSPKFKYLQVRRRTGRKLRSVPFINHLRHRPSSYQTPSRLRQLERRIQSKIHGLAGRNQVCQRRVSSGGRLLKCPDRRDLRDKSARLIERLRQSGVPRSQRLPDNIIEWMHYVPRKRLLFES